jgi:glycosyltransferase involved in cell wall biosynthesis
MGEHFGVSIAEAMASGCIPIVHDSGGPREFVPETFRFNSVEEAAKKIERAIFEWTPKNAGKPVQMAKVFSEEHFVTRFLKILNSYVHTKNYVA